MTTFSLRRRVSAIFLAIFLGLVPVATVLATTSTTPTTSPSPAADAGYGFIDPLGSRTIPQILGGVVRAALGFVGAVFLLFFVWGGFLWMTSGGDTERVKKARASLLNALIGILIVFFSYVLVNAIIGLSSEIQSPSAPARAPAEKKAG